MKLVCLHDLLQNLDVNFIFIGNFINQLLTFTRTYSQLISKSSHQIWLNLMFSVIGSEAIQNSTRYLLWSGLSIVDNFLAVSYIRIKLIYSQRRIYSHKATSLFFDWVLNTALYLFRAKALQSVIAIKSPAEFKATIDDRKASRIRHFNEDHAKQIVDKWRESFINLVNKRRHNKHMKTNMLAFSTISFENTINKYTKVDQKKALISSILLVRKAQPSQLVYGLKSMIYVISNQVVCPLKYELI